MLVEGFEAAQALALLVTAEHVEVAVDAARNRGSTGTLASARRRAGPDHAGSAATSGGGPWERLGSCPAARMGL